MQISILSLFPRAVRPYLDSSILGRAQVRGLIKIETIDLRDYAEGRHRVVDDIPYGGGAGMVLKPEPLVRAVRALKQEGSRVVLLSPQGRTLNQAAAVRLSEYGHLILVCGHYRGVDERVLDLVIDEEISIGDYVLSGGEVPALVLADAVARMVPGVVTDSESSNGDSFMDGFLDHPHFTRPENFEGLRVPGILRSGNHGKIREYRSGERLRQTQSKRPDLVEARKS